MFVTIAEIRHSSTDSVFNGAPCTYCAGEIVTVHVAAVAHLRDGEPLGAACSARAVTDCVDCRLAVFQVQSKVCGQMEVGKQCCV